MIKRGMGKILKNILKNCSYACLVGGLVGNMLYAQRTEMQSNPLKLNKNDSIFYVTNKNEKQGIKDIKKIINNSNYEEYWLYLPEKKIWYEIGINSSLSEKRSSVEVCNEDIEKILRKNKNVKELVFYHNHPYFSGDSLTETEPISEDDFRTMILNSLDFSDYKVKEKICSKKGINEYFLTEKVIKEFSSKNPINFGEDYSYLGESIISSNPEYLQINFKPFIS